jgi:hypothetical protein
MKMFTTIILTAGAIGVMCASGMGVSAVFNWLNTTDISIGNKDGERRATGGPAGGPHGQRLDSMKNRMKPSDF